MRRSALVLLVPFLVVSCSSDHKAGPADQASPTASCPLDGPTIPDSCVENGPAPTTTAFPADASKIVPVTLPAVPGRLGGAHNRDEASKRTETFTVTVPKGSRIGSDLGCLGNGSVTIDTVPASRAFQSITCNADPTLYSELTAEDTLVLDKATTFTVTVKATAASRWEAVIYATTEKIS